MPSRILVTALHVIALWLHLSNSFYFLGVKLDDGDDHDFLKRELDCLSGSGKWKMLPDDRRRSTDIRDYAPCYESHEVSLGHNQCTGKIEADFDPSIDYYWDTSSCSKKRMEDLSVEGLCSVMKGHGNILFVGDSLIQSFAMSLKNRVHMDLKDNGCSGHKNIHEYSIQCSDAKSSWGLKVMNYRNDRLSLVTEQSFDERNNFWETPWHHLLIKEDVGLVVMNRGAHYEEDDTVLAQLKTTLHYIEEVSSGGRHRPVSVVWKNIIYGHSEFKELYKGPPLSEPEKPFYHKDGPYTTFDFREWVRQDRVVKVFLEKNYPSTVYMDTMTMTSYRADSHSDVLHYCIPGPIDEWVRLFYNYLTTINSIEWRIKTYRDTSGGTQAA